MDDGAPAAVAGEFPRRDQGGDRGRRDALTPLVDDEAAVRVAVEGEAEVGALGHDPGLEVHEVLRVEGVGLVVGEGAVEFEVHRYEVDGQVREDGGDGVAAHAVARVDDDLQRTDRGDVDQGQQVGRVVGEGVAPGDGAGGGDRPWGPGRGPLLDQGADLGEPRVLAHRGGAARQSLMPLYWAGLCEAVNIAPGRPRLPEAKYSWSVEQRPMSVTSAPRAAAPRAKAPERPGDEGRMSCPITIASASVTSTNAAPNCSASDSSHWSGTTPRTSYAFTICARSAATGRSS